jgi:hypothetical protein
LRGVLEESTYLGAVHRYLIRLGDGTQLHARMPALSRGDVWVGDTVQAVWSDQHAVLLQPDGQAPSSSLEEVSHAPAS